MVTPELTPETPDQNIMSPVVGAVSTPDQVWDPPEPHSTSPYCCPPGPDPALDGLSEPSERHCVQGILPSDLLLKQHELIAKQKNEIISDPVIGEKESELLEHLERSLNGLPRCQTASPSYQNLVILDHSPTPPPAKNDSVRHSWVGAAGYQNLMVNKPERPSGSKRRYISRKSESPDYQNLTTFDTWGAYDCRSHGLKSETLQSQGSGNSGTLRSQKSMNSGTIPRGPTNCKTDQKCGTLPRGWGVRRSPGNTQTQRREHVRPASMLCPTPVDLCPRSDQKRGSVRAERSRDQCDISVKVERREGGERSSCDWDCGRSWTTTPGPWDSNNPSYQVTMCVVCEAVFVCLLHERSNMPKYVFRSVFSGYN
eukprot:sb/3465865/